MRSHLISSPRWLLRMLAVSTCSLLLTSTLPQAADPATTCETAKLKAAGKMADCLAKEEAKAILGKPSNPALCVTVFTKAFTRAETTAALGGGACRVTGDVAAIGTLVNSCVDDVVTSIGGIRLSPCQRFPATGQTTPYTADKNDGIVGPVAVPDDGTLEAGVTLSYTDNGDGTITDNNTGLMWEKKDDLGGLHDKDNVYPWSGTGSYETIWDWIEDVNAEGGTGYAEHNDWRIPNRLELESILDAGRHNPSIDPIFGPTKTTDYWSSTSGAYDPSDAWGVDFSYGYVYDFDKSDNLFVRAVRGGS